MKFSGIRNRIQKIERMLPSGDVVLLDDGTVAHLPAGGAWQLFLDVIAEHRSGTTPPCLQKYGHVIDRAAPRQRGRSLIGMTRAIRMSTPHDVIACDNVSEVVEEAPNEPGPHPQVETIHNVPPRRRLW